MEYHKFIHSEEQVRKFVSLLSPLKGDEAYFLSMSARNKYLTEEERKHFDLGRTEMFARKLVKRDKKKIVPMDDNFIRVLKSMQVSHGGYTSRSGVPLPDKCMVVYANINPVSGIQALKEFQTKMLEAMFDLRTNTEAPDNFSNLDTLLMNCYQRSRGTRTLIDIDFDIPDEGIDILKDFIHSMRQHDAICYVIKTKSGYHVLIEKNSLKFNYVQLTNAANILAQHEFGKEHVEVMVNKNEMVPVPGTIQSGFAVHFLDI